MQGIMQVVCLGYREYLCLPWTESLQASRGWVLFMIVFHLSKAALPLRMRTCCAEAHLPLLLSWRVLRA
jgi:hypothetical protein